MNAPPAQMFVSVRERTAWLAIHGRANAASSLDLRRVVTELRQRGYDSFVLDLSQCQFMDSTFLGVLAGFGAPPGAPNLAPAGPRFELLNPNALILELLEEIGVLGLFKLSESPRCPPGDAETATVIAAPHSREEVTRTCLAAHERLMELNPDNIARFKDVTRFLAEDLKRLKAQG